MSCVKLSGAQVAEVISSMTIAESTDLGATVAHKGNHPTHGEIIAISSAIESSLMVAAR